jgi:hypothetical protein
VASAAIFSPKGWNNIAQGNALEAVGWFCSLKGCDTASTQHVAAFQAALSGVHQPRAAGFALALG